MDISKIKTHSFSNTYSAQDITAFPIDPILLENSENIDLKELVHLAYLAGEKILEIYHQDFEVSYKEDNSPLTLADLAANTLICSFLKNHFLKIPIISEELKEVPYQERKNEKYLWLIDPIDGTKEFVKRTGEFTVNIGLVENGEPILGVVNIPCQNITYFAAKERGAYKINHQTNKITPIFVNSFKESSPHLKLVVSVSHPSKETEAFVSKYTSPGLIAAGSSLKLLKVAEGSADIYPRLGPTSEWDTGAAHAILKEAGGICITADTLEPLHYNKENLKNPFFICYGNRLTESD